jgi:hypothetical protein
MNLTLNVNLIKEFKRSHGRGDLRNLRRYEKCSVKVEKCNNNIKFLVQCKKEKVIPNFLKLKVPFYRNRKDERILEKASTSLLAERISDTRRIRHNQVKECERRLSRLKRMGGEKVGEVTTASSKQGQICEWEACKGAREEKRTAD